MYLQGQVSVRSATRIKPDAVSQVNALFCVVLRVNCRVSPRLDSFARGFDVPVAVLCPLAFGRQLH